MTQPSNQIIIVGAGGAGLVAAWKCAVSGAPVTILERNPRPGIKLLISGGGKCNVTHAGPMQEVEEAFLPGEARFLRPSFYRFANTDILALLAEHGVKANGRPNGRVFPESGRAKDVVEALVDAVKGSGGRITLGVRVEAVQRDEHGITGIVADGNFIPTRFLILATGGLSYPKTGTTGDGISWAQTLGHTIVPLRAALAPIGVNPPLPKDWRGVSLRAGCLSVVGGGKKIASWPDDILFSHEGISGPAALEVSRQAAEALEHGPVYLEFDFFPQKDFALLDAQLNEQVQQQRGRMIGSVLESWLPNRLVDPLLRSIRVDPALRGHVLTAQDRKKIVHLLKSWNVGRVSTINIERGEVSAGGVSLREVDPRSMRSRRVGGLYLCGEMLDIAGPVGGYNLQAAFSTGFVAGESAATDYLAAAAH